MPTGNITDRTQLIQEILNLLNVVVVVIILLIFPDVPPHPVLLPHVGNFPTKERVPRVPGVDTQTKDA